MRDEGRLRPSCGSIWEVLAGLGALVPRVLARIHYVTVLRGCGGQSSAFIEGLRRDLTRAVDGASRLALAAH
jgi:hypothetical protein